MRAGGFGRNSQREGHTRRERSGVSTTIRSVALVLVAAVSLAGGTASCGGCPAALIEGVLVRDGADLVVRLEGGGTERVAWSESGNGIRSDDGTLVVTDWIFLVKAREGDYVKLGGGEMQPGIWKVCGQFDVMHAD